MVIQTSDLTKFSLLSKLPTEALQTLSKKMDKINLGRWELICQEDTAADSMFFILQGKIIVTKNKIKLAELGPGDYFGEMSLLEGKKRDATVTTDTEATVIKLSKEDFIAFILPVPHAVLDIALTFDARLRKHNRLVIDQYTEIKNKFLELKSAHEQLLQTEKLASIGTLTAGIAHEINNPLMVINGYLSILMKELEKKSKDENWHRQSYQTMKTAADSIAKIVTGLKTYVRMDDGVLTEIKLHDAIQGSIDLVSFLYKKEGIELSIEFAQGTPIIKGNIGLIQQVIMNLLSNSKHALENAPTKKITIKTRQLGQSILIDVTDSGKGIPPEHQDKIFKKYLTTKEIGKGTGLGLDLIKGIIQKMNGEITFKSEVNVGTTFTVTIPIISF